MSFEEKVTWVSGLVILVVSGAYFIAVAGQLGDTPVADIEYQRMLLIAVGATIVLTIVGSILTGIGSAIGAEIEAKVAGRDSAREIDVKDERDVQISRRGELVGYYVSSAGILGVLALAMLEYPHFWIANALYLSLFIGSLASATAKIVAYRRGF